MHLNHRYRSRIWPGVVLGLLALTAPGCSYGISVRKAAGPELLSDWHASITAKNELSQRTMQTLRRWDLDLAYQRRPEEAYVQLQAHAIQEPQPEILFALAEISYQLGRKAEQWYCQDACVYYYFRAGYAYHYLFGNSETSNCDIPSSICEARSEVPSAMVFDPRFRLACDLYNAGLAKCIRAAQKIGRLDPRQELHLGKGGDFTLSVVHHGFPWKPAEFGSLLFCSDYEVVGLANQYRSYGLGVSLIGTRLPDAEGVSSGHAYYPREVSFPVTAFFRFEGSIADMGKQRSGKLELYNPLEIQTVAVQGRKVPLETDMTMPLAYFLSRTDLEGIEFTGFLNADKVAKRAGIYMFEPYQPGKIPVLMVHGLLGSPLTWTTMFNDLRADPFLRRHFQFWFYLYPSGNPYLATAADLRRELDQVRCELDPRGADPALNHLVLVGHSMGGLVSKLLTVNSGTDFWALVSPEPLDHLQLQPETRTELHQVFYFETQPAIGRVVFLATPHHGSKLSPSFPAQLVSRLIHLPKNLMHAARDVARENPNVMTEWKSGSLPTSVDLLAPGSPALELLAARPKPRGVHFHSIVGDLGDGSDGVVPVASAHLDGVDSEIIVPAYHTEVHHHPRAVMEVWRILQDHWREVGSSISCPPSPTP